MIDLLNCKLKSDTWYYNANNNTFLIYFVATEQFGTVDVIAVHDNKVTKGRGSLSAIAKLNPSDKVTEAPNQDLLNILYRR